MLRGHDAVLIPVGLFWVALPGVLGVIAVLAREPVGLLFAGPAFLFGAYVLFGRLWVDAKRRAKTAYGLTERRIIIVSGISSRQARSLDLRGVRDISIKERDDGRGTITFFGPSHPMGAWFPWACWPGAGVFGPPMLEQIERAREVYDRIVQLQREGQ